MTLFDLNETEKQSLQEDGTTNKKRKTILKNDAKLDGMSKL